MVSTKFVMSEEERVAADNLIKVAEAENQSQWDGTRTVGILLNNIKDEKDLLLQDQHSWSENSVVLYPQVIHTNTSRQPVYFSHVGPLPVGSKGGVVYADGRDSTARMWLVAFNCVKHKVYVEAGPIGPVDWNVVEVKLSQSGSESEYEDPVFHGKAAAYIHLQKLASVVYARFLN